MLVTDFAFEESSKSSARIGAVSSSPCSRASGFSRGSGSFYKKAVGPMPCRPTFRPLNKEIGLFLFHGLNPRVSRHHHEFYLQSPRRVVRRVSDYLRVVCILPRYASLV